MSDRLRARYAEACTPIKERCDELDAEIGSSAAYTFGAVVKYGSVGPAFGGAARRYLTDRIVEKLALLAVLDAHDVALEAALDEARREAEYKDRVIAPQRAAEDEARQRRAAQEEKDARVRRALDAVKQARQLRRPPDPADVETLQRNSAYTDHYTQPGAIEQLLYRVKHDPWWREQHTTQETGDRR